MQNNWIAHWYNVAMMVLWCATISVAALGVLALGVLAVIGFFAVWPWVGMI